MAPGTIVKTKNYISGYEAALTTDTNRKGSRLGGVVVIVLVIGPKVRGLKPDRGRWTFKVDKNP
jgi:hypothetical protein